MISGCAHAILSFVLHSPTDQRVTKRAAPLLPLIDRPEAFRSQVNNLVAKERERLKLKQLDSQPF
jgi:hypothetical protein